MPITPTYPGVYIQEVPSGVRTIMGVSTSTAVFIGRAKQGPLDTPVLCLNYSDFERAFSGEYMGSDMARSVRLFFQNGGMKCYAMRIAKGATYSEVTLKNELTANVLKAKAKSPGLTGDTIRLAVTYNGLNPESTFNLEVFRWTQNGSGGQVKTGLEKWTALSMDPDSPRYAPDYVTQNSQLIELIDLVAHPITDSGYSQSGRAVSDTAAIFWETWRTLLAGVNTPVMGTPWGGTSTVIASGVYTGAAEKTFTFTVNTAGTNTVGTDVIDIGWDNGAGNTGTINLPATYVVNTPAAFSEGLSVSFGAGDLIGGEKFTVIATPARNRFRISVDGGAPIDISLSSLNFDTDVTLNSANALSNLHNKIQTIINNALPVGVSVTVTSETGPGGNTTMLKIRSANGDVRIEPAAVNDLAVPMMLGTAQGGSEVSRYARYRPAPSGIVFYPKADLSNLLTFAGYQQDAFNKITIGTVDIALGASLKTTPGATDKMYQDAYSPSTNGNRDGVREKLGIMADKINEKSTSDPTFKWTAQVWGNRLALIPGEGNDNSQGTITSGGGTGTNIASLFITNVRYYSLGPSGQGSFQVPAAAAASDGSAPDLTNYRGAFDILDKEVDLFNLMILPRDEDHSESQTRDLWGPASVFCRKRRAFLLIDAPLWATVQDAVKPSTGVNSLRVGLEKDHSAIFYPRITIRENGFNKNIGPSGAIAGLMARIDANRGVWKAPAGTEAALMGIVGLEYKFSDDENGVLNPRAINTLRVFPDGIVNWGARTMDGDDDFAGEYKYIPVRRLALFIEESLYRGTKWVVFEPNDEPLWAQIRLNVGAFMHNLFRQGAFQGTTPNDAYLVKCDKETTTQNDINQGIVNILVGFAPLKPAEFVIIKIQQMAGQIVV